MKTTPTHTLLVLGLVIAIAIVCGDWILSSPELAEFPEVRARWYPSDAQLLDRNGDPLHEIRIDRHGRRLAWTPLSDISPALQKEVIASEDHRFATHRGVDPIAIAGALAKSFVGSRPRGASTITMQLVAMLDPQLRRNAHHRGVVEKLAQMQAALALERRWSKDQILESYLNLATWRGELQGIGAASRVVFGRAPHGIDQAEAIALASLLRAPNANRAAVERRRVHRLLGEDRAPLGRHLGDTADDEDAPGDGWAGLVDIDHAGANRRDQRRMPGQNTEIALGAGHDDHLDPEAIPIIIRSSPPTKSCFRS